MTSGVLPGADVAVPVVAAGAPESSVADVVAGRLPEHVRELTRPEDAWASH